VPTSVVYEGYFTWQRPFSRACRTMVLLPAGCYNHLLILFMYHVCEGYTWIVVQFHLEPVSSLAMLSITPSCKTYRYGVHERWKENEHHDRLLFYYSEADIGVHYMYRYLCDEQQLRHNKYFSYLGRWWLWMFLWRSFNASRSSCLCTSLKEKEI
jgi:hypothetical protein